MRGVVLEVVVFESGAQTAVVPRCGARDCPEVEGVSRTIRRSREAEARVDSPAKPRRVAPRRKTDTANNSRHIIAVYSFLVVFVQSLTCSSSVKPLHLHI